MRCSAGLDVEIRCRKNLLGVRCSWVYIAVHGLAVAGWPSIAAAASMCLLPGSA